jgi:hypothetical protein
MLVRVRVSAFAWLSVWSGVPFPSAPLTPPPRLATTCAAYRAPHAAQVEFVGGFYAHSLAIMSGASDGPHNHRSATEVPRH